MKNDEIKIKKIILIGCGIHYRNVYHPVIEKHDIEIELIIDLESDKTIILQFFKNKKKPNNFLFLNNQYRNDLTLDSIRNLLPRKLKVDGVLICTDPKVRKNYTLWSIENGFPIFMDKPISAFSKIEDIDNFFKDYDQIYQLSLEKKIPIVVSCERRAHFGYLWLKEYLEKFIHDTKIPITCIDIHFAGGVWLLPSEYMNKEQHPFKYGHGILLHSGYHYVDLLISLISLNQNLFNFSFKTIPLHIFLSNPMDQVFAIKKNGYNYICNKNFQSELFKFQKNAHKISFGETDISIIGQIKNNRKVITNFSLKMFGLSISNRKKSQTTPQLEGKIRQEQVIIHLGPYSSIHISSKPLKKLDPKKHQIEDFSITIMNSPLLKKYPRIVTLNRADISKKYPIVSDFDSLNKFSRKTLLIEFLKKSKSNSFIDSHQNTNIFLNQIYAKIKKQYFS